MIEVVCADRYEALKLTSLIQGAGKTKVPIRKIINVFDEEVIVGLLDGSAHSITLADARQAEAFSDFMQSVLEETHLIDTAKTDGLTVTLTKKPV